ncbi:Glutamate--tRNA ligase [Teratosphaeria destructans]|uniref:glutamate--tRNA ligase n=1 Tax=Teratosphaeria destructans TaxID=418781 RepID=A0A9W7SWL1_9PEZI|nr:Glutamate--tRNA ligase [Teratosphaeria destructans]
MSTTLARPLKRAGVQVEGRVCQSCQRRAARAPGRLLHLVSPASGERGRPAYASSHRKPLRQAARVRSFSSTRKEAATDHEELKQSSQLTRKPILPDKPARTRFAPSPTGHLHIGGLRTALFSHLLAHRTGGQFLLRIEDTDQKRLVPGAEERLLEDLRWAGLEWDEGPEVAGPHGPYRQSERNHIYQQHARQLLDADSAYRCFCSSQTVKQDYVVSGCHQNCASLSQEESQDRAHDKQETFTVRLRRPEDAKKRVYPDLIYGKITPLKRSPTAIADIEVDAGTSAADVILIKSDGSPTYHFANVVDDHLMEISHVIRGSEWMASTPLHYDLYHAFGWTPPVFAHVGLLVDETKAKLSKRNMGDIALDVRSMREELKVLPEALCNFLALLGWSNPTKQDALDMRELTSIFDLKFTKGNAMVKMDKLWYLQKRHVARRCDRVTKRNPDLDPAVVEKNPTFKHKQDHVDVLLRPIVDAMVAVIMARYPAAKDGVPPQFDDNLARYCQAILLRDRENYKNAEQYVERYKYLFDFDTSLVPEESEFYDKKTQSIDAETIFCIIHDVLGDFGDGWVENVPEPNFTSSRNNVDMEIAAAAERISQCIDRNTAIFVDDVNSNKSSDQEAVTRLGPHGNQAARLKNATMKYLREKLCHGLPGPHMPDVMALLGYSECCRRLGFE